MSSPSPAASSQAKPRLAGLFYAITIAAGLFAEIGVRSAFRGNDALSVAGNAAFYRMGEMADVIMLCCYLAVTTLLYELLRPAGHQLSLLAAAFSMTGIAVLAGNGLLHMAALALIEQVGPGGFCVDRCDAATATLLALHGTVYGISLIFFGIYCMLIGWLIVRSRAIPIAVGIAMMAGGSAHLVTKTAGLLDPDLVFPTVLNVLPLSGEAMLAIWLLLFGMRKIPHDRPPQSDGNANNGLARSAFQ
ncbi:hypothetical protein EBBID32_640 [Sphingobium indicum BiD32]|uniref:DUF4386 domain-containing protein n=1 Tax=Sphingobium indicum BiD32 TaxID=1301087 RepID=N1MFL9_9SPHN|nr:DUF4386 domain-containing protein [Sphingobium indicum]CCW15736.1 hypothetical protein EBBID32_640 [Sphingobium indicum BiD32]